MATLPTPGGDVGTWGDELNTYLLVAHNPDGTDRTNVHNVLSYGATGNGTTVDTTAVQAAITAASAAGGGTVFFPEGTYVVNGVNLAANVTLLGAGHSSIIKQIVNAPSNTYMLQANNANGGSADPTTNMSGITIRDLQLLGRCDSEPSDQFIHLLMLSAVSNVMIDNVLFRGWIGDGIYLGSGTSAATERHNERIKIIGCHFDGIDKSNRNAITVIDATDLIIFGNSFRNCTAADRPGAIDIEPNNNTFARCRDIKILYNDFVNVGGNVGVIAFDLNPTQDSLTTKSTNLHIIGNTIRAGTGSTASIFFRHKHTLGATTVPNDVIIADNMIDGGAPYALDMTGVRGAKVMRNVFKNQTAGITFGYAYRCDRVLVEGNTFYRNATTSGTVVEIYSADYLRIQNNVYDNPGIPADTGRMCAMNYNSSPASTSSHIDMIGNKVVGSTITTICSKDASHVTTASTNACYLNDVALTPNSAHFDKQAVLTYSRTGEPTSAAALRTELASMRLLVDATTA